MASTADSRPHDSTSPETSNGATIQREDGREADDAQEEDQEEDGREAAGRTTGGRGEAALRTT